MTELTPVPAATVVLVRPPAQGSGLEVLLLQRNSKLVFHGGHWVFPGGRIDDGDYIDADKALEYPAAVRAAVRETEEEAGLTIAEADLVHTAHWTTPPKLPRRFCTWFFICPVATQTEVQIDNSEILNFLWIDPAAALEQAKSKAIVLPNPTQATLKTLVGYDDVDSLLKGVEEADIHVYPHESPYYRPTEMGYLPAK